MEAGWRGTWSRGRDLERAGPIAPNDAAAAPAEPDHHMEL